MSNEAEDFLSKVSKGLEYSNKNLLKEALSSGLSPTQLDRHLVHEEQTKVQGYLDGLSAESKSAIVDSINDGFRLALSDLVETLASGDIQDFIYLNVLQQVVDTLGRPIDFANQKDRELIGNSLIKSVRGMSGATTVGAKAFTHIRKRAN